MADNPLLESVNILTPEFKAKIDALGEGETLELRVIPSDRNTTIEQMQKAAFDLLSDRRNGILKTTPLPYGGVKRSQEVLMIS